jgi:hypothetical protein
MTTVNSAVLERAADKILEANTTLIEKERTAKRQRLDALNRHAASVLRTGTETVIADIQNVLAAQFMDDSTLKPSAFGRTDQERYFEAVERASQNKRRAKLEAMELAPHTAANLHAEVKALELAITRPTSDKALKADVAKLESILRRLDVAKIFEMRIAPLLGVSRPASLTATRSKFTGRAFAFGALMHPRAASFVGARIVCNIGAGPRQRTTLTPS